MKLTPVMVNVAVLKVNALDHSAVLNLGPSQHADLFVSYKRNQGIGEHNGDRSPVVLSVSWVTDCDLNDASAVKNSIV